MQAKNSISLIAENEGPIVGSIVPGLQLVWHVAVFSHFGTVEEVNQQTSAMSPIASVRRPRGSISSSAKKSTNVPQGFV